MRIDDTLNATKAAVEEGVVPGGGLTLLQAINKLDSLEMTEEQKIGLKIIKKALEGPIRQIAENAGKDGSEVIAKLKNGNSESNNIGYNAKTDKFEDLIAAGVIDPTKVVRHELQSASSIAAMVLTTEGLVTDFEDEKDTPQTGIII
jgi:chaperonin GroEL